MINCGSLSEDPTNAMAGSDQTTPKDTIHLNANSADGLGESGKWTIINGSGASFSDDTSPLSEFNGNGNYGPFILRWSIENPCGSTYDEVTINFRKPGIYVLVIWDLTEVAMAVQLILIKPSKKALMNL